MLNSFIIILMLSFIVGLVYKMHDFALKVMLPISLVCLLIFFVSLWYKNKHVMSEKKFESILLDIINFYNSSSLRTRYLEMTTGSKGAYVGIRKLSNYAQLPTQQFYQNQGVGFNPFTENYLGGDQQQEAHNQRPENWRDRRAQDGMYFRDNNQGPDI